MNAATPTVPPIITNAPVPMDISAMSRIVSLRYRVSALGGMYRIDSP